LASLGVASVSAFAPKETQQFFNGPVVGEVSETSAVITLSPSVIATMTPEEKAGVYLEYFETHKVCIMIYPTPAECLPKKLPVGQLSATVNDLKPNTEYQVTYKFDNTIRCITTPCPSNDFESQSVVFTTKPGGNGNDNGIGHGGSDGGVVGTSPTQGGVSISRYLTVGSRGEDVTRLQYFLNMRGFLTASPTGYYGLLTRTAVKKYQASYGVSQTGSVGPVTRGYLAKESL
jgi:hypothetical protein